jgi:hypothetical protein
MFRARMYSGASLGAGPTFKTLIDFSLIRGSYMTTRVYTRVIRKRSMKRSKVKKDTKEFSAAVGRALRRAAKVARKTARMHGTPIYVWKDGKIVAEKP